MGAAIQPAEAYVAQTSLGQRLCWRCNAWHSLSEFESDPSRSDGLTQSCRASRSINVQRTGRSGPLPRPPLDGDKIEARQRVNVEVQNGRFPHPNDVPCVDCGHLWTEGEGARQHQYDHYLGYGAAHHYDVQIVCSRCHGARGVERGEFHHERRSDGRFVRMSADG